MQKFHMSGHPFIEWRLIVTAMSHDGRMPSVMPQASQQALMYATIHEGSRTIEALYTHIVHVIACR